MEPVNRERLLTLRKDHKLHQPRFWCGRQQGDGRPRRSQLYVLQQHENQAVSDIRRQFDTLVNDLLFPIVVGGADRNLACESVDQFIPVLPDDKERARLCPDPAVDSPLKCQRRINGSNLSLSLFLPRPDNLWAPRVSRKCGKHSNRDDNSHCFNGFQVHVTCNIPGFGARGTRTGFQGSRRSSSKGHLVRGGVTEGDHLRASQREPRPEPEIGLATGTSSGKLCAVSR
jgi:hypothetical protein